MHSKHWPITFHTQVWVKVWIDSYWWLRSDHCRHNQHFNIESSLTIPIFMHIIKILLTSNSQLSLSFVCFQCKTKYVIRFRCDVVVAVVGILAAQSFSYDVTHTEKKWNKMYSCCRDFSKKRKKKKHTLNEPHISHKNESVVI